MADGQEKLGRMVPFVPSQVLLCRLVQSQTLFRGSRCSEFGGDGEGIMDPGGGLARPHPSRISHPLSLRRCWGEQRSLLIRHRGVCRCRHAGVGKACQGQQSHHEDGGKRWDLQLLVSKYNVCKEATGTIERAQQGAQTCRSAPTGSVNLGG